MNDYSWLYGLEPLRTKLENKEKPLSQIDYSWINQLKPMRLQAGGYVSPEFAKQEQPVLPEVKEEQPLKQKPVSGINYDWIQQLKPLRLEPEEAVKPILPEVKLEQKPSKIKEFEDKVLPIIGETLKGTGQDIVRAAKSLPQNIFEFARGLLEKAAVPPIQPEKMAAYVQRPAVSLKDIKGGAIGLATYFPKVAIELAKNPRKMITERPLDVIFLLSAMGGTAGKGIGLKAELGKTITTEELGEAFSEAAKSLPELQEIKPEIVTQQLVDKYNRTLQDFMKTKELPEKAIPEPTFIATEKGTVFPAELPEATKLQIPYAEERAIPGKTVVNIKPREDGSIDVTLNRPETPKIAPKIEPIATTLPTEPKIEAAPTPTIAQPVKPKIVAPYRPRIYKEELYQAINEAGGVKPNKDFGYKELRSVLPFELIKKTGQPMDEVAATLSEKYPNITDDNILYKELKDLKIGARKEAELTAKPPEEYYEAEAAKFNAEEAIRIKANELLGKTGKSIGEISSFKENEFMDGKRAKEITQEVMDGRRTEEDAITELKGLIEDTVSKPEKPRVIPIEEPAPLKLTQEKEIKRAPAPTVEEKSLVELAKKPIKYPKPFDEHGYARFKDINIFRKAAEPARAAGWKVEYSYGTGGKNVIARILEKAEKGTLVKKEGEPIKFGEPIREARQLGIEGAEEKPTLATEPEKAKVIDEERMMKDIEDALSIRRPLTKEQQDFLAKKGILEEVKPAEETKAPEETEEIEPTIKEAPKKVRLVRLSVKTPDNQIEDLGALPEERIEAIRQHARKLGIEDKLKVGNPFEGEWDQYISPKEIESHVKKVLRDVKVVPKETWEKWAKGESKIDLPYDKWKSEKEGGFLKIETKNIFGKSFRSKAYTDMVDRFHPIKQMTDVVKKEGVDLPPINDPYLNVRNYMGVQGKAETKIFFKRFEIDNKGNVTFKGKSLRDILKPVKKEIDLFDKYLVYRRIPELTGREIETGIDLKEATEYLGKYRKFEPPAKEFTEYHESLLKELKESGFFDEKTYNLIRSKNQLFAPFQRVIEGLEKRGTVPSTRDLLSKVYSPIKKIKGSDLPVISPLESTIRATYIITNAVERNNIGKKIVALRKLSPEMENAIQPIEAKEGAFAQLLKKEGVISIHEEGKIKYYKVPKDLYDCMSQLTQVGQDWLVKMLSIPARIQRTGITTAPEFAMRNPIRDQWSAFVNAKYGYMPGVDFVRGLFHMLKQDEQYWKWKATGGDWSMLVTLDRATNQATLKKVLGNVNYKKFLTNPIKFLEDISMYGEQPTRIGVFRKAAKKVSDIEAAFESKEATVDFQRRGAKMKTIASLYTFFNARLQGMEKLMRSIKERPLQTSAKILAVATIPSVINYLVNRDDPKYWEIPEWQRDLFWIIPIKGHYFRIPKGDTGVLFGTTAEKVLQWIDKDAKTKPGVDKLARAMFNETFPISDIGGFLPVALRVPFETVVNRNFFYGRPIVPRGKEQLAPKYQYSPYTSETIKALGKAINVSPQKLEHLIAGFGGGLARHAIKGTDIVLGEMGVVPKKPEKPKELADYLAIGAFAVREPSGFNSESINKFYDVMDKLDKFKRTYEMLKRKGQIEEAKKWLKDNPIEKKTVSSKLYSKFINARDLLSEFRKVEEKILESDLSATEKKKRIDPIDARILRIATVLLAQYRAIENFFKEGKTEEENK